jgi:CRP/FNR family transcriptional activator FtrB
MRASDREKILSLNLFGSTSAENIDTLLSASFLQRFPAHVDLIREGEQPDFFHIVIQGLVEIFATDRGRETTVTVAGPGQSFILAAVMLDQPYLQAARTMNPSHILMLPATLVRRTFDIDPGFARVIATELAQAYRTIAREVKNQKLRTSLERLANWIIRIHDHQGKAGFITLPYDKRTLAARLGMTPENLSRNFASLEEYGVDVAGREIRLNNLPALVTMAKPSPWIDTGPVT